MIAGAILYELYIKLSCLEALDFNRYTPKPKQLLQALLKQIWCKCTQHKFSEVRQKFGYRYFNFKK